MSSAPPKRPIRKDDGGEDPIATDEEQSFFEDEMLQKRKGRNYALWGFRRGSGRHQRSICKGETLQDSAPVTESEQDFCSQSGEIVDIFENQLETLKLKSLQHGTMAHMLERKQAKQQRRVLFEEERCAQRKAW